MHPFRGKLTTVCVGDPQLDKASMRNELKISFDDQERGDLWSYTCSVHFERHCSKVLSLSTLQGCATLMFSLKNECMKWLAVFSKCRRENVRGENSIDENVILTSLEELHYLFMFWPPAFFLRKEIMFGILILIYGSFINRCLLWVLLLKGSRIPCPSYIFWRRGILYPSIAKNKNKCKDMMPR